MAVKYYAWNIAKPMLEEGYLMSTSGLDGDDDYDYYEIIDGKLMGHCSPDPYDLYEVNADAAALSDTTWYIIYTPNEWGREKYARSIRRNNNNHEHTGSWN